jgi:hypothetical protein
MFLGLPDPDPSLFVRTRILPSSSKNRKKALISYCLMTSPYHFLSLKHVVNVGTIPYLKNMQKTVKKKIIFCCHLEDP